MTIYELRQGKNTTLQAHTTAITAASFSPDGKFLVSYACGENKLSYWQTSTGKLLIVLFDFDLNSRLFIVNRYVWIGYRSNKMYKIV